MTLTAQANPTNREVELDGRRYRVSFRHTPDGKCGALVYQQVRSKTGTTWRSLQGHGRQWRPELANRVVALAKSSPAP